MTDSATIFDRQAAGYDAQRRRLIPPFDAFYGTAVDALALAGRAAYVTADLADPLPPGPWDAVVSALAIHHLDDAGHRALFARVHDALSPGGVFVNAEQVAGPSARFDAVNRAWHRERAMAAGSSPEEWAGAEERMAFDRCASVDDQLAWLRAAGFDADCLFKDHRFAVLAAVR